MTTRKRPGSQRSTFRELLQHPTKKLDMSENGLSKMIRDVLLTNGISPAQWDKMADLYYRSINANSKGEVDLLKVIHDKSNMAKALAKDSIPYNRFLAACEILGPEYIELGVTLHFKGGISQSHKVMMKNSMREQAPLEGDEDEDDVEDDSDEA